MERDAGDVTTGDLSVADDQAIVRLHVHQRAWEVFGIDALKMIPILQAHMSAVTQETERAAMELMMYLRILTAPNSGKTSHDRAESLSKLVMAMQFQDITRQKLEHVSLVLDQFKSHLQALMKGPGNEDAEKEIAALGNIEQKYTMEEERRLHRTALNPECPEYGEPVPIGPSEEGADSVTIF